MCKGFGAQGVVPESFNRKLLPNITENLICADICFVCFFMQKIERLRSQRLEFNENMVGLLERRVSVSLILEP